MIRQIEHLGLLVNVVFVGDRLLETVRALESSVSVRSGLKAYLIFHYTPSRIASLFNLTTVKFEPCYQRWDTDVGLAYTDQRLHEDGDMMNGTIATSEMSSSSGCFYNFNRFAKVRRKF